MGTFQACNYFIVTITPLRGTEFNINSNFISLDLHSIHRNSPDLHSLDSTELPTTKKPESFLRAFSGAEGEHRPHLYEHTPHSDKEPTSGSPNTPMLSTMGAS